MRRMNIDEYREKLDGDEGLAAKRKAVVIVSLLLLALCVSGAAIKEANTFIFRVEFSNHAGLTHLLGAAVAFLMLRYYAYAQSYHSQLFDLWAERLLSDYRVFSYDTSEDEVNGLLGKVVDVWGGDEPGIQDARYKKVGILKRNIAYTSRGHNERHGEYSYEQNIELNSYSEKWTKKDFQRLLRFEFKCRLEAVLKHREYLDIMFPYLLGLCALLSLIYKIFQ